MASVPPVGYSTYTIARGGGGNRSKAAAAVVVSAEESVFSSPGHDTSRTNASSMSIGADGSLTAQLNSTGAQHASLPYFLALIGPGSSFPAVCAVGSDSPSILRPDALMTC